MQVVNHGARGATTRNVWRNMWTDIIKQVKSGDIVVIELGHNDNAQMPGSLADKATGCGSVMAGGGAGSTVTTGCDGSVETVYTYSSYLTMMCAAVREAGATCIISSIVPKNEWKRGNTVTYNNADTTFASQVAQGMGMPFVPHYTTSINQMNGVGGTSSTEFYLSGDTFQTNTWGAEQFAQSFAAAAYCNGVSAITSSLTPAGQALQGKLC